MEWYANASSLSLSLSLSVCLSPVSAMHSHGEFEPNTFHHCHFRIQPCLDLNQSPWQPSQQECSIQFGGPWPCPCSGHFLKAPSTASRLRLNCIFSDLNSTCCFFSLCILSPSKALVKKKHAQFHRFSQLIRMPFFMTFPCHCIFCAGLV